MPSTARCSSSTATTSSTRARTRSRPRRPRRRSPFKWHQFGYTADGPVWQEPAVLHVELGRLQGRQDDPGQLHAADGGDARRGFLGARLAALDPATCTVAGTTRSCQTFPGNRIPANRIHSISQKLLEFYPEPNAAGDEGQLHLAAGSRHRPEAVHPAHGLRPELEVAVDGPLQLEPRRRGVAGADVERLEAAEHRAPGDGRQHLHAVADGAQRVPLRLQLLLQHLRARAGVRARRGEGARHSAASRQARPKSWGIPTIGISGYSGFGDSTEGPYTNRNKVFEFTDNLSWFRGPHSFKAGGSVRFDHYNQVGNQFSRGSFNFDGRATGSLNGSGHVGRRRLCRLPARLHAHVGVGRGAGDARTSASISQAYYFTDTWRVRDDMTLDLGIRYEYVPPWLDKSGTLINAYLPFNDTGLPVADLSRHPVLVRIGEGDFYEDSPIRFAPNIKTSRDGESGRAPGQRRQEELRTARRLGVDAERELVGARGRRRLLHAGHRQPAVRHGAQRGRPPAGHRPTRCCSILNWGAPFSRLGHQRVRRAAAARLHLEPLRAGQPVRPQDALHGPVRLQRAARAGAQHGGGNRLPRVAEQAARADVRRQRGDARPRQRPDAAAVSGVHQDPGDRQRRRGEIQLDGAEAHPAPRPGAVAAGRLHAVEVRGQRQRHPRAERRRAVPAEQQLLRVRVGAVDLRRPAPVGHLGALRAAVRPGQAVGAAAASPARSWAAGRSAPSSTSPAASRGTRPLAPTSPTPAPRPTGRTSCRARIPTTGRRRRSSGSTPPRSRVPAAFTYGDAGRNIVVGPGIFNTDASIIRNFMLGGSRSLQFRLEAFNLFNKPIWGDPDMSMSSPLYGQINTTRTPMRELQLGVKFSFCVS